MKYSLLRVWCLDELKEIFIAELAALGFAMMEEKEGCIEAFADEGFAFEEGLNYLREKYSGTDIRFET